MNQDQTAPFEAVNSQEDPSWHDWKIIEKKKTW